MRLLPSLLLAVLAALVAVPSVGATSVAPPPPKVALDTSQAGWIGLSLDGLPASSVRITDRDGDDVTTQPTAAMGAAIRLARIAPARCDLPRRSFTVEGLDAAGTPLGWTVTATGAARPCTDRFALRAPARVRPGRRVTITAIDRWRTGVIGRKALRACVKSPGRAERCSTAIGARTEVGGPERGSVTLPVGRRAGRAEIRLWIGGAKLERRSLSVLRPAQRLRVLAAGDSMIQILDGFLAQRLGRRGAISVRSDAHISTGISNAAKLNWQRHAAASAREVRPDVTVMFIGANDGWPMRTPSGATVTCCGAGWQREYQRRVATMMRSYARSGAGTVYWLLLPTPSKSSFARVFRPVNAAIAAAARDFPDVVRTVPLPRVFTPGGRFRSTMVWNGRRVTVRQSDGVHLSTAGASIAAELVIAAMRRDGLLGGA